MLFYWEVAEGQASGAGMGTLTTGLARAELALEEARELEFGWPLGSEGCPHSPPPGRADRNKGTGSAKVRWGRATQPRFRETERSATCKAEEGGQRGAQVPLGKADHAFHSCKETPTKNF